MADASMFDPAARWIWDAGEASPRNAWRCFRRRFWLAGERGATLTVTADTRYVAYVNGVRVGHGPVRAFSEQWCVDTWDIGHHLREGSNDVAILVLHHGVWTFQDRRARGGLLAQIDADTTRIVTDQHWEVGSHGGHQPRAPRICPQLAFVEIVDGGWCPSWTTDTGGWPAATVIGEPGEAPWEELRSRPIPALTEAVVTPVAVRSAAEVTPASIGWTVDCRAIFDPTSAEHANPSSYVGYLVTGIRVSARSAVHIGLPLTTNHYRVRGVVLDGRSIPVDSLAAGHANYRSLDVTLDPGLHWLAVDVSMYDHGYPMPLLVDGEGVRLESPMGPGAPTVFAAIGPVGAPDPSQTSPLAHPAYERMKPTAATEAAVAAITAEQSWAPAETLGLPIAAVGHDAAIDVSLYGALVHPRFRHDIPVTSPMQGLAAGSPVTVELSPGRDVELVLDMGSEISGFIMMDLDAPPGVVVDVYGFEYLEGGYREETEAMENAMRYRTRAGRQRYESPIRRGLRYLQVVLRGEGAVVVRQLAIRSCHYPAPRIGTFASSDGLLTEIWEMSRRTVVACMEDTFVDCPAYEQAFWVGDTYSSARFASALFDATPLIDFCLRLVPQSARQTPLLTSQVPSGWTNVIPAWTFLWARACLEHARRTGDRDFRSEIGTLVADAMDAFTDHLDDRSLLAIKAWNLLDWAPMDQPNAGVVTHQNALFVLALRDAAAMVESTDQERAHNLRTRADLVADAVAAHLWDAGREAYIDAIHDDGRRSNVVSVQTHVFVLLARIGSSAQLERSREIVTSPPDGVVQIGSPWMSIFRYDALQEAGHVATALADLRRDYGAMLRAGARTCWEKFPAPDRARLTRSHCHAWSAAPASFLPTVVLGIQPDHEKARVQIAPFVGDLEWARGAVPMAGGVVEVSWRREGKELELEVSVPQGIEVLIREPEGYECQHNVRRSP